MAVGGFYQYFETKQNVWLILMQAFLDDLQAFSSQQTPNARADVDLPTLALLINQLFGRLIEMPPETDTQLHAVEARLTHMTSHALFRD